METHWDTRWERERPEACSTGNRITHYAVNDLKKHLERRACENWVAPMVVKVYRKTWGKNKCDTITQLSDGYEISKKMCADAGRPQ